jgi:4'-phosphopantetheinyl transferase
MASGVPPPAHDTVELRWLAVQRLTASDRVALHAVLDPAEQARAARFRDPRDRHAYTAAHALARGLLARHLQRDAAALRFVVGPHGKPRLADTDGAAPLHFNLTHTREVVAVALSRGPEVGVDVEALDAPGLDLHALPDVLTPAEARHLRTLAPAQRADAAAAVWTLKEATVKASGRGLDSALQAIDVGLNPLTVRLAARFGECAAHWRWHHCRPLPTHALALAVRHTRPRGLRLDARAVDLAPWLHALTGHAHHRAAPAP